MSDQNVAAVIEQLRQREARGMQKYGVPTDRAGLRFIDWLQHLQEELLDAAVYIEQLKRECRAALESEDKSDDSYSG